MGARPRRGSPTTGLLPLHVAAADDLTTYLNSGTIVAAGDSVKITIPAGTATPDIGDCVCGIWRARDLNGGPASLASGEYLRHHLAAILETGTPNTSGNVAFGVALVDSSTLTTCNGVWWEIQYSGAARQVCASSISSGTATRSTSGNVTADRVWGHVNHQQPARVQSQSTATAFNTDWVTSAGGTSQGAVATFGTGDVYWVVTGRRTATTLGAEDLQGDVWTPPADGITLP